MFLDYSRCELYDRLSINNSLKEYYYFYPRMNKNCTNLTMSWETYSSYCKSKGKGWSMAWFDKYELEFLRYLLNPFYEYMIGAVKNSSDNNIWGEWIETNELIYSDSFTICSQNSSGSYYVTLKKKSQSWCLNELMGEAEWICKRGELLICIFFKLKFCFH